MKKLVLYYACAVKNIHIQHCVIGDVPANVNPFIYAAAMLAKYGFALDTSEDDDTIFFHHVNGGCGRLTIDTWEDINDYYWDLMYTFLYEYNKDKGGF